MSYMSASLYYAYIYFSCLIRKYEYTFASFFALFKHAVNIVNVKMQIILKLRNVFWNVLRKCAPNVLVSDHLLFAYSI